MGSVPEKPVTLVRRPLVMLAPAVLLVVALALATNILPLRQIVAQRQEIVATQATLDALMEENAGLDAQVSALATPIEVERIAREELGYVRPGETAFIVMDPTPASDDEVLDVGTAAQPASVSSQDRGGFLTRLWDYMTGRDLVSGG